MNWDAVAAVAEIVAAVAVLTTLIYLALQVRGLSADLYSAHLSRMDEGERDLRRLKIDYADVLIKAASIDGKITELEKFQLSELYRSHEAFFFFAYLRSIYSGGDESIVARNFAEALAEYPAFIPIYTDRDFSSTGNTHREKFGELVSQELERLGT